MPYAGNPTLSPEVQKRVLGTFEQTVGLAAEGNRQEALLGCDFVLRMDPQFEPARRLQERLRKSAGAIVDLDDLMAPASPASASAPGVAAAGHDDLFSSFDALSLDLPEVPVGSGGFDLRTRLQALLEERRFEEMMGIAEREAGVLSRDPELMRIVGAGQERMEAEPYVQKFLGSAREALRQGQTDDVARHLDKARSLDPTHPGIAEVEASLRPAAPLAAPAAFATPEPSFDLETSFADPFAPEPFPPGPAAANPAEPSTDLGFGEALPDFDFGNFDAPAASLDLGAPAPSFDLAATELPSLDSGLLGGSSAPAEGDDRIRQLLDEGQAAFDGGDPQGAIDAWSRIFLIDIDHQEAARRIEQARRLKAESDRQVEEVYHEGVTKLEAGDTAGARQAFQLALEIQPGYYAASEAIQQLDAGMLPAARSAAPAANGSVLSIPSDLDFRDGGAADLKEEILIPPDPSEMAAAERRAPRAAGKPDGRARKTFALIGAAVLALVLAGGWFFLQNRERLFPNSQTEDVLAPAAQDPIARATELHKGGKTASAISQLRRLPPSDPHYQEAQALIAQWETTAAAGATDAPAPGGPPPAPAPPAIPPERLAALTAAREAYSDRRYLETVERLEKAAETGALEAADAELLANAKRQLEPISLQIDLVRQHEWEMALRDLWRLREKDPGNRDVTRLMVDSYYNLGVRELQRGDAGKAKENFQEALELTPRDESLRRHLLFSQTYQERPADLLYRIYVQHLPTR